MTSWLRKKRESKQQQNAQAQQHVEAPVININSNRKHQLLSGISKSNNGDNRTKPALLKQRSYSKPSSSQIKNTPFNRENKLYKHSSDSDMYLRCKDGDDDCEKMQECETKKDAKKKSPAIYYVSNNLQQQNRQIESAMPHKQSSKLDLEGQSITIDPLFSDSTVSILTHDTQAYQTSPSDTTFQVKTRNPKFKNTLRRSLSPFSRRNKDKSSIWMRAGKSSNDQPETIVEEPTSNNNNNDNVLLKPSGSKESSSCKEEDIFKEGKIVEYIINRKWNELRGYLTNRKNCDFVRSEVQTFHKVALFPSKGQESECLPLHAACAHQSPVQIVTLLLKLHPGAVSSRESADAKLPIHIAVIRQCSEEVIQALIDAYPGSVRKRDEQGRLAIHYACACSDTRILEAILRAHPQSLYVADAEGNPPVIVAQISGNPSKDFVLEVLHKWSTHIPEHTGSETEPSQRRSNSLEGRRKSSHHTKNNNNNVDGNDCSVIGNGNLSPFEEHKQYFTLRQDMESNQQLPTTSKSLRNDNLQGQIDSLLSKLVAEKTQLNYENEERISNEQMLNTTGDELNRVNSQILEAEVFIKKREDRVNMNLNYIKGAKEQIAALIESISAYELYIQQDKASIDKKKEELSKLDGDKKSTESKFSKLQYKQDTILKKIDDKQRTLLEFDAQIRQLVP